MYTIQNISDLLITVNHLYELLGHQIAFDSKGWPIFQKEHFINDWPEDMVTFDNRNSKIVKSKSSTLLCHFTGDRQNYRRFLKLNEDLPVYRNFCGVVFPDITVTYDMDIEMQRFTLLANQLYAATLAVNGIRLVVNTRCGSLLSLDSFDNIPRGVICASSFLGCRTASNLYDTSDYINKILKLMPSKLVIYGKQDFLINSQLDILGVNYRYYEDFHRRCKRRSA